MQAPLADYARLGYASPLPALAPFTPVVYEKAVERIGLLPREVANEVVTYYGYVLFINDLQRMLPDYKERGDLQGFYDQYHRALDNHLALRGLSRFQHLFTRYGVTPTTEEESGSPYQGQMPTDIRDQCKLVPADGD